MAINFPSTPGDGEEYTDANSGTWVYDSGTNSWTLTAGGSTSAFNFRGGHDFTSSTPPADPIESGDMWIHDAPDGTVDAVYTGISGQIGNGQLVLWDGNSYVMVSGTLPGYPDVGDGEDGTLDSRYLKLGANAGDQIVASTDTTTFNGVVEAGSGVEVTGGKISTVNNGIVYSEASRSLRLLQNGRQGAALTAGQFVVNGSGDPLENSPSAVIITGYITPKADGTANPYVFSNFPGLTGTANNFTLNNASFNTNGGGTVTNQCIGYDAARSLDRVATTNIAYRGRLRSQSERNNFNFYTEGDASNFFEGDTYIGGTATRSTRELWESTLTEEQQEQLEAGTLTIPANVSTPGDGSFVRQWWYYKQSAEDQALIDSGELDYPKNFQAANFTDTFTLGDNTLLLISTQSLELFTQMVLHLTRQTQTFHTLITAGSIGVRLQRGQSLLTPSEDGDNIVVLKLNPFAYLPDTNTNVRLESCIGLDVSPPTTTAGSNETSVVDQYNMLISVRSFGQSVLNTNGLGIGVESKIANYTSDGRSTYNFFAGGNAPNFFEGNTYIGGTATRSTRELWESTLTEEQQEQLSAGTLAIPANVSTPGDGSFVRQWWYDQQSAEDQALIDAGELDYPKNFQAANFTDTFDLGENTNINLLKNGLGEFGGGVGVTGSGFNYN